MEVLDLRLRINRAAASITTAARIRPYSESVGTFVILGPMKAIASILIPLVPPLTETSPVLTSIVDRSKIPASLWNIENIVPSVGFVSEVRKIAEGGSGVMFKLVINVDKPVCWLKL